MGNGQQPQQKFSGPIFGQPIEVAAERSDTFKLVPYVLRSAFAFLNAKGLDFEGLYRINGSKVTVNKYKDRFNKGERLNFLELNKKEPVNPCNIAALVYTYFKELPEPILTKELMGDFAKVTEQPSDQKLDYCKKLLTKLPPVNKQTLKLFMEHLVKVAENQHVNHMSIDNLLLCITGASKNTPVFLIFLQNYEEIFLGVSKSSESNKKRIEAISYIFNTTDGIPTMSGEIVDLVEDKKEDEVKNDEPVINFPTDVQEGTDAIGQEEVKNEQEVDGNKDENLTLDISSMNISQGRGGRGRRVTDPKVGPVSEPIVEEKQDVVDTNVTKQDVSKEEVQEVKQDEGVSEENANETVSEPVLQEIKVYETVTEETKPLETVNETMEEQVKEETVAPTSEEIKSETLEAVTEETKPVDPVEQVKEELIAPEPVEQQEKENVKMEESNPEPIETKVEENLSTTTQALDALEGL